MAKSVIKSYFPSQVVSDAEKIKLRLWFKKLLKQQRLNGSITIGKVIDIKQVKIIFII